MLAHLKDPLTGLYSRASFSERLHEEFERALRYTSPLSLLFLDLDHFKSINDAFGHSRGDAILQETAFRVHSTARSSDICFRWGGDEFVLLLPNTEKPQARKLAERLLHMVQDHPFGKNPSLNMTVSIGVSAYPMDVASAAALFDNADLRLQGAKRHGRAQVKDEDPEESLSLPFGDLTRLQDRDQDVNAMHAFINALAEKKRGILMITGSPGCGKSRFLQETCQAATIQGYATITLQGSMALKTRYLGAFNQSFAIQNRSSERISRKDIMREIWSRLRRQKRTHLLLAVDDMASLDPASTDLLHDLLADTGIPVCGVCYTVNKETSRRTFPLETPLREAIELKPLTQNGLRVWLRILLQWEPDSEFCHWLYHKTGGMPGMVKKGLTYLLERGLLQRQAEANWRLQKPLHEIDLKDSLESHEKHPPHNLPLILTTFIGRNREIDDMKKLLSERRLLTLVGPGGIGKTRLSLQFAAEVLDRYPHGVFFVTLEKVSSPEFIISAIADAMAFSFFGPVAPKQQLINYLREKRILLILDNFEHLVHGPFLLPGLLESCPGLKILITSQERLRLHGESVYKVQGLRIPLKGQMDAGESSAVQLFIQSARRVSPHFNPDKDNLQHIITVCRLVDGMPLAIELAASWVHMLSCAEIVKEMENNLDFLSTSERDVPERHQSIRAVFEHSWQLLKPEEQTAFKHLSIFRGEFQRQAAQEVANAHLPVLSRLMDKSLLQRTPSHRYYMLEVLRQYGLEKLCQEPEKYKEKGTKHSRFYGNYVHSLVAPMLGSRESECLTAIAEELENIYQGWQWALEHSDWSTLTQYVNFIYYYHLATCLYTVGLLLLKKAITAMEGGDEKTHPSVYGRLLLRHASLDFLLSNYAAATPYFEQGLHIFQKQENNKEISFALNGLGAISMRKGNYEQARAYHAEALALDRKRDDIRAISTTLNNMGNVLGFLGENALAKTYYQESLELTKQVGNRRQIAAIIANLGIHAGDMGNLDEQKKLLQESLSIRMDINDTAGVAISLDNLGTVERFTGNYEEAQHLHTRSLSLRRQIGDRWGIALSLLNLGNVLNLLGKGDKARESFEESLAIYEETGDRGGYALALNNLAGAIDNDRQQTARLLKRSIDIFSSIHNQWGIAISTMNLAALAYEKQHYHCAERYYKQAITHALSISSLPLIAEILVFLAKICFNQGNRETAKRILQTVLQQSHLSRETRENAQSLTREFAEFSLPNNNTNDAAAALLKMAKDLLDRKN